MRNKLPQNIPDILRSLINLRLLSRTSHTRRHYSSQSVPARFGRWLAALLRDRLRFGRPRIRGSFRYRNSARRTMKTGSRSSWKSRPAPQDRLFLHVYKCSRDLLVFRVVFADPDKAAVPAIAIVCKMPLVISPCSSRVIAYPKCRIIQLYRSL